MTNLQFQYEIIPGNHKNLDMKFMDKPLSSEKNEIKLRERFYYQQAYFLKQQALLNQNIDAVIWVEDMIEKIKQ